MYKSPIEVVYGKLQTKFEGDVVKAVQSCNIHVDKDELIKALAYDRDQYEAGYMDAMATIVRCKDCKHWNNGDCYRLELSRPDDYCSYGVRKDGADE